MLGGKERPFEEKKFAMAEGAFRTGRERGLTLLLNSVGKISPRKKGISFSSGGG